MNIYSCLSTEKKKIGSKSTFTKTKEVLVGLASINYFGNLQVVTDPEFEPWG